MMDDFDNFEFDDSESDDAGYDSGFNDSFDGSFDDGFDDDLDGEYDDEAGDEEGSSNRTFIIVAGILGAILILAIICLAVYAMVVMPQQRSAQATQAADVNAQNTQVAMAAAMTAQADAWTLTPTQTNTPLPATVTPSPTAVIAATSTPTGGPEVTVDPRTATVAALLTQQAGGLTLTPTATQLPDTGFIDDVGIPGMLALAAALIVVIFLARRLRTAA